MRLSPTLPRPDVPLGVYETSKTLLAAIVSLFGPLTFARRLQISDRGPAVPTATRKLPVQFYATLARFIESSRSNEQVLCGTSIGEPEMHDVAVFDGVVLAL